MSDIDDVVELYGDNPPLCPICSAPYYSCDVIETPPTEWVTVTPDPDDPMTFTFTAKLDAPVESPSFSAINVAPDPDDPMTFTFTAVP